MDGHRTERRDFLKQMTALGAAGVPGVAACGPTPFIRLMRQEDPE